MPTIAESIKLMTSCGQRYLTNYLRKHCFSGNTRKKVLPGFFHVNIDDECVLEHKLGSFVLLTYFTIKIS